ncbi:hypothetical protein EYF80_041457 [Liparis tanakae]|uniref:Uncharacterized protein n=1 Tax=Liparis tanakae TaxID=230148 RepID=A0A4Z2G497_9TELE|nr:hypothetical protein EYF80_041457 [Liparis tanakae]
MTVSVKMLACMVRRSRLSRMRQPTSPKYQSFRKYVDTTNGMVERLMMEMYMEVAKRMEWHITTSVYTLPDTPTRYTTERSVPNVERFSVHDSKRNVKIPDIAKFISTGPPLLHRPRQVDHKSVLLLERARKPSAPSALVPLTGSN